MTPSSVALENDVVRYVAAASSIIYQQKLYERKYDDSDDENDENE